MSFLRNTVKFVLQVVLPLVILAVAVLGAQALIATRPEVAKEPRETPATLVSVYTVGDESAQVTVEGFGTVRPARVVDLSPQVSGMVVEQNPRLVAGGYLEAGEMLLRIDPRDYELAVREQEGALETALFNLEVEQGRAVVAEREWALLDNSVPTTELGKRLALREPHIEEREAAVEASRSRLEQAMLNLERTTLQTPFNAMVVSETIDVGQYISPSTRVANLVGTDTFHVYATVPYDQLDWVRLPDSEGNRGARARVILEKRMAKSITREGRVVGLMPDVDPNGRLARLLIEVRDPLGRNEAAGSAPLLLGAYVRVEINGPDLEHVSTVPREAMRENGRVWIATEEDTLEFREVEVMLRRDAVVLLRSGVTPGERVITSAITTPLPGMRLRYAESQAASPGNAEASAMGEEAGG